MKLKLVLDLDIRKRKLLQRYIGKEKGLRPEEYKLALSELIDKQLFKQLQKYQY
ncbi:MAG: hypothetical protein HC819_13105 [Cyclobacteriaceae bacterium]|nr:hypothetical protein [Cyclobacteriaceae bacterium]